MSRNGYLKSMGISVWKSHRNLPYAKQVLAESDELLLKDLPSNEASGWVTLQHQITECVACELCQSRTNSVVGRGSLQADMMVIGEAPSDEEDAEGQPFTGLNGNMLDQMLYAIGLSHKNCFMTNLVKCRSPDNRDPKKDEVASCQHFLLQQIDLVKPKVILAVGRIAAQNLLETKETISQLRGNTFNSEKFRAPIVAIFHPAYLMRSPTEKRKAWVDLVIARKLIEKKM